ncbi:MAG TPA: DUF1003 domain-containing protein [Allosphingosinicella sp.]|jgi:uncharacterized membrane protein
MNSGPTVPPPGPDSLNRALARNIAALRERERRERSRTSFQERLAEAITRFTGSLRFVYVHLALYGGWIVANLGWIPGFRPWDPTFVVLAMIASVEAIFLSTFVLISQNRMAEESERRASLDLQINLLAEHEVTRLMTLVSAIAHKLEVDHPAPEEIEELKRDVAPEAVLDAIEEEK